MSRPKRIFDAAITGARAGGGAAIAYVFISITLIFVVSAISSLATSVSLSEVANDIPAILLFFLIGGIVGGIPASIVGAITTVIMAVIFEYRLPKNLSLKEIRHTSIVVSLFVATVINAAFIARFVVASVYPPSTLGTGGANIEIARLVLTQAIGGYVYFLGIPTLIYLGVCLWLSPQVYARVLRLATETTPFQATDVDKNNDDVLD